MALRKIVVEGDPVLKKKSRPVEKFDARLAELLDDKRFIARRASALLPYRSAFCAASS